jgi:hypothetical protein
MILRAVKHLSLGMKVRIEWESVGITELVVQSVIPGAGDRTSVKFFPEEHLPKICEGLALFPDDLVEVLPL